MGFCRPCQALVARHEKAARRVAFLLGLALFCTVLGLVADPVVTPGLCKVYP